MATSSHGHHWREPSFLTTDPPGARQIVNSGSRTHGYVAGRAHRQPGRVSCLIPVRVESEDDTDYRVSS